MRAIELSEIDIINLHRLELLNRQVAMYRVCDADDCRNLASDVHDNGKNYVCFEHRKIKG